MNITHGIIDAKQQIVRHYYDSIMEIKRTYRASEMRPIHRINAKIALYNIVEKANNDPLILNHKLDYAGEQITAGILFLEMI